MRITGMCFQNLLRRKVRTLLCVFGIGMATMFIITVGATTSRYTAVIKEMNLFFQGDVVVVSRGVFVVHTFPIGGTLQESTVAALETMSEVEAAIPMLFILNPSKAQGTLELIPENFTLGIPSDSFHVLVGSAPLRPGGSWPNGSAREVVIGPSLADWHNLAVNSLITLKDQELRISGILETRSAILSRAILMPLQLSQKIYGYNLLVNMIIVKPKPEIQAEALAIKIENEIDGTKALTEMERNEFIKPILDEADLWNTGLKAALFLMSLILVTSVSMMNMFERRRDFATLYAIGCSKFTIVRIVLTEASLLGLFGGLLGIVLGGASSILIVSYYTSIPTYMIFPDVFIIVPPFLMAEILISSVLIGSLAGVIPALTLRREKLEEILRYEY